MLEAIPTWSLSKKFECASSILDTAPMSDLMNIRIQTNDSGINWTDVANLFKAVGWGQREPDDLRSAFSKRTFKCFAFDDTKLVGFGRTIDDGKYMATVVDMIVHPDYQRAPERMLEILLDIWRASRTETVNEFFPEADE